MWMLLDGEGKPMEGFKQASEKEFIHSNKTLSYFTMKIEVARSNFALTPAKLSTPLFVCGQLPCLPDCNSMNNCLTSILKTNSCVH